MVGKDWVTLVIAVAGLGLSLLNTWQAWRRDKPRVSAECRLEELPDGKHCLVVKLVNTGRVPVLIEDMAISLSGYPSGLTKVAFRAQDGNDHWKNKKLPEGEFIAIRSATHPGNLMDDVGMAFADGLLLKLGGAEVRRFKSDALREFATYVRYKKGVRVD